MGRNNTNNVGDIIRKLMKNPKLSAKLDKLDALQVWDEIIGKNLKKYVIDQSLYNDILYVKLKSSVVRNELSYKKTQIKDQINQRIGKAIVKEIVLK
tara:strand:+ start:736 stop:1026 length:291 start_codon:yes stop_codon:yes gene_type:complete